MAGIGFELKKMFSKKGVFQLIRAYGYAGTVCVGPMLLGMFFLILIFILWKLNAQKYAVSIAVGIWLSAGLQIPCLIKQLTLVKNGRKILFRL